MTKTTDNPDEKIEREVGERVDLMCQIDTSTVKELGDGVFEATITTQDKDRMNEVIITQGVDPSTWEKTGMPVLYGHDYSGLPIGKGLSFKSMKTKFTAKFQLAVDILPFAATVADMIKAGYLNAVSIGGVVRQWSEDYMTIEQMEMVEFSVVAIPANPNAVITSRSLQEATGKTFEQIRQEYREAEKKNLLDTLEEMPDDEVKDAIKGMKLLLARLEEASTADPSLTDENSKTVKRIMLKDAKALNTESQKVIKIIKLK